jgi:hypothetical protein
MHDHSGRAWLDLAQRSNVYGRSLYPMLSIATGHLGRLGGTRLARARGTDIGRYARIENALASEQCKFGNTCEGLSLDFRK